MNGDQLFFLETQFVRATKHEFSSAPFAQALLRNLRLLRGEGLGIRKLGNLIATFQDGRFFYQDMFNMSNVGNSWNTVVIYPLPCTVYMSICSMNSVSSSNIRTVYRY